MVCAAYPTLLRPVGNEFTARERMERKERFVLGVRRRYREAAFGGGYFNLLRWIAGYRLYCGNYGRSFSEKAVRSIAPYIWMPGTTRAARALRVRRDGVRDDIGYVLAYRDPGACASGFLLGSAWEWQGSVRGAGYLGEICQRSISIALSGTQCHSISS